MKPNRTNQTNFIKATHRLEEAVVDYRNIPINTVRDGVIQRFEFTFELAWKALKEYMLEADIANTMLFPKQVLREAYAINLIDGESIWLDNCLASNRSCTADMLTYEVNSTSAWPYVAFIRCSISSASAS